MKKKFCSALLLFAALIALLPVPTRAAGVLAGGECGATGNDVTWTLDRDGLFTVQGAGAMRDYANADSLPWYSYRDQVKTVVVEQGVTTVGNNAFRTCSNLASVTLPEGLTHIGSVSFYECAALEEITLPESVTTIGANAFGYCALKQIAIPAGVSEIGGSAFFKCVSLTAVSVDESNEKYSSVDGVLFDKLKKTEETDPDKSLLILYPAAKSETNYVVPDGIVKIEDCAFQSAVNLKEATLPAGVTEIGQWAFSYNTVLSNIELPKSLTTVGDYAFYGCTALSSDDGKSNTADSGVLFHGNRQEWSALVMGTGNNRLTNANINFEETKQDNVIASGECGALGSNASWSLSKEGELLISGTGEMVSYRSAASVPWADYRTAEGNEDEVAILTVTVEGSVTEIINDAGERETVKKGITNIGNYAFYDCVNLTKATLPPTLQTIGAQAFSDCAALAEVDISKSEIASIGDYAFNGCAALTELEFPDTLKTIGNRAFLRSGLTSVTLPLSVEDVGEWAFRWCDKLESLTMEALKEDADTHYTAIGDYAFADCAALKNAFFTENLTVIGEYAFSKCAALASVAIPASVSEIGLCAFYSCPALTGVVVNADNQSYSSAIGLKDGEGNVSETEVGMLLNKDLTCIFFYPIARQSVSCAVPETVSSVAAFAFDGVKNLTDVYYYGTKSEWDDVSVGQYNAPLQFVQFDETGHTADNAVTLHWEEPEEVAATSIDAFMLDETEEGRTALVTVYCGEETYGAEALCALYDADGRFLSVEAQEVSPGMDNELSFALSAKAASVRLFVRDGYGSPCCPAQMRELAKADESEQTTE